jgi:hypothetical protein
VLPPPLLLIRCQYNISKHSNINVMFFSGLQSPLAVCNVMCAGRYASFIECCAASCFCVRPRKKGDGYFLKEVEEETISPLEAQAVKSVARKYTRSYIHYVEILRQKPC